jgi:hypothetical protein
MNDGIASSFIVAVATLTWPHDVQLSVSDSRSPLIFQTSPPHLGKRNASLGAQPIPRMPHQFEKFRIFTE